MPIGEPFIIIPNVSHSSYKLHDFKHPYVIDGRVPALVSQQNLTLPNQVWFMKCQWHKQILHWMGMANKSQELWSGHTLT